MKSIFLLLLTLSSAWVFSQTTRSIVLKDSTKSLQIVDVACGTCKFEMAGSDCELAAKIGPNAYFVDGTSIDAHGDAHGPDGFCQSIRRAEIQGDLVGDRFKVTYFRLLPKKQ